MKEGGADRESNRKRSRYRATDSTVPGVGPDIAPLIALGGQTMQLEVGAGAAENRAQHKPVTSRI